MSAPIPRLRDIQRLAFIASWLMFHHDPKLAECGDQAGLGGQASGQFRGLDREASVQLLVALDAAGSLQDLSPLRSLGLHKLKGDRKKQWAMTVNDRWRICFEFRSGDAFDVEIVDYHKG